MTKIIIILAILLIIIVTILLIVRFLYYRLKYRVGSGRIISLHYSDARRWRKSKKPKHYRNIGDASNEYITYEYWD